MRIARLYLFFIMILVFPVSYVFSQNYSFANVTPPREFPFTFIYGITQDPQGYMWIIASQQLYRYDGYKFTIYMNDPSNPNSMAGTRPECVYADKKGFIWIGNANEGLDRLDPRTGIFTHYIHNKNDPSSISTDSIRAILEDHNGDIWVGTMEGLDRLDPKTGKFIHYAHDQNDPESLSNNNVRVVYEDKSGTIWAGTGCAWYGDSTKTQGGLNRFDPKIGKFIRYLHDPNDSNSLIDNRVSAICEDSRGVFWVGTAGNGLHTMDRANGKFQRHPYDPLHPDRLSRPALRYFMFGADDYITFIKEDITGAIWIGTLASGMNRYDPKTQRITHFESVLNSNPGTEKTIGYFQSYSSSRDGELWISSYEGNLFKLDPLRISLPYNNNYKSTFHCFLRGAHDEIWVGTAHGLWLHEPGIDKNAKLFFHDPKNEKSISGDNIHCIFQDKDDKLWVGTDSGLNQFDYNKQSFISYRHSPKNNHTISSDIIYSLYEDHHANFWIGTSNGLNKMDRKTGSFTWYKKIPGDTSSLSTNFIKCILEDKHHLLWLGRWFGGGVNLFDPSSGRFKQYLKGSYITSIFEDSKEIIWVGTNTYLYRYDRQKDNFIKYSDENGLIDNIYVNYITEDNERNLWVSSFIGFTKINPTRTESIIYNGNQGMDITDLLDYSGYKDKNGTLYFSDNFGYYSFLPEQLVTNDYPPAIILTAFRLEKNGFNIENIKDSLSEHINDVQEIALNHDQNSFSFDFVAFHYSHPEDNKHYYMLENYDNNWHAANNERTAGYFNIPPGKYTFRVKARSSNGVWAQKSIAIIIAPPWWYHIWFWIAAAICAIGLFYILIRWRLQQKFRIQLERSEKEKQMAEMRHKSAELEMQALRAQMNPHFIFNSLNSINRFILQNNRAQASQFLIKFSKLVRLILQNSQASLISLESELESLELYLDLEALRFNYHFGYKISVPKDLDVEVLKVPPLIIQPYVENAIWHGLMHKEEKGQLDIEVSLENNHLFFKITDDGIGRKQSAVLASKSATKHKSMGLKITADRIAMLKSTNGNESPVTINDLVNVDGSAAGTEVIIKMPLIYD